MHSIYKITNKVNGKIYVGQTNKTNPEARWTQHKSSAKNGDDCSPKLYRSMRKHGIENFTFVILEHSIVTEHANDRETFWITHYDSINRGLNCILSKNSITGINNPFYGKTHSEEAIRKMREWHATHSFSPEHIQKLRDNAKRRKGIPLSEKQRQFMSKINIGRKATEETRHKLSISHAGQVPWNKNKTNPKIAGVNHPKAKYIYSYYNPIKEIINTACLKDLCKIHNLNYGNMLKVSNGTHKQHKGWIFISKEINMEKS